MPKRAREHDALLWIQSNDAYRERLLKKDKKMHRMFQELVARMRQLRRPLLLVVNEFGGIKTICKGSAERTLEEFDDSGYTVNDLHPLSFSL